MRGDMGSAWRRRLCGHLGKGCSRGRKMKAEIQRRKSICNQQGDWSRGHWARGGVRGTAEPLEDATGRRKPQEDLTQRCVIPSQGGTVGAQGRDRNTSQGPLPQPE